MASETEGLLWRKSSRSPSNDCVEMACRDDWRFLRDSKMPDGSYLKFTAVQMARFLNFLRSQTSDPV
ncbi:DUF397 domain-containing protein [Allokutzneria albata]|uniref:DUF397 domain-containing protein n=1 Tax=Allokutzneria albata TaxID=211114 RepID=A0A1G9YA83_ALLAB|nr:DUF397 domain-containing protein [Allokutzneria albata]SDN06049.1 protein of unknown function [Allokutzneria albata]